MASRDEVLETTFTALDRHLRRVSVAEVGEAIAPDGRVGSCLGGRFVGTPGETWPLNGGEPMIPLLQIRTDELPHRPSALDGVALVSVFAGPRESPSNFPAANGDEWVLRAYPTLEGLAPLPLPAGVELRSFPVRWNLVETDAPRWQDAWDVYDLEAFNDLEDANTLYHDRYENQNVTKVGGWPSYIQASVGLEDYVFQIGFHPEAGWMWGDAGNGYVLHREGKWSLYWDCY